VELAYWGTSCKLAPAGNIALGKGEALKIFNDNILEFKFIKEIKN